MENYKEPEKKYYDDVELTEDEMNKLIGEAKKAKFYVLERQRKKEEYEQYLEDLKKPFTPHELQAYVLWRARKEIITDREIIFDDKGKAIFKALCYYFTNNPEFETMGDGWKLKKGLLLMGNVGTGKTKLMEMFSKNKRQSFLMARCSNIAGQFADAGGKNKDFSAHEVLNYYSGVASCYNHHEFFLQKELGYCFDDLGTESTKKNFGNEVNVMIEILYNRYANNQLGWHLTHITTNLTPDQIEETYGYRVRDRMREMFNVIEFTGESLRI